MTDLTHTALGSWSGGRCMHFGEPIDEDRLIALLRPGDGIDTVITADAYGAGAADELVGRALAGLPRESYRLVGAIGHDFYDGERQGAKGFPRFTDPTLRGPGRLRGLHPDGDRAQPRALRRRPLRPADAAQPRPHRLHERGGLGRAARGARRRACATRSASRPARRTASRSTSSTAWSASATSIDWAMVILNPFEPWPGELVLDAARATTCGCITRVVDYGGIFHGDVAPGHAFGRARPPHFRPEGWVERGLGAARADAADRRAPRPDDAAARVRVEPRARAGALRRADADPGARRRRAADRGAARGARRGPRDLVPLSAEEVAEIRAIGDNTGSHGAEGRRARPRGRGARRPLAARRRAAEVAARWSIDPDAALRKTTA